MSVHLDDEPAFYLFIEHNGRPTCIGVAIRVTGTQTFRLMIHNAIYVAIPLNVNGNRYR